MINRIAACSCGQLNATVTEAPIRVSICHCTDCQRRTGSVFASQARFPKDAVKIAGSSTQYIRLDEEGRKKATFHFCPHCSAILYWQLEAEEGMILIPVGAFADPGFPTPTVSVWEREQTCLGIPCPRTLNIFNQQQTNRRWSERRTAS